MWTWAVNEMGGEQYARFAFRHNTPIVPIDHECHPLKIIERGFKKLKPLKERIEITRWPMGLHFYAILDGKDVVDSDGNQKWPTHEAAYNAAFRTALEMEKV